MIFHFMRSKAFWLGAGAVLIYEFFPVISKAVRPMALQVMKAGYDMAAQAKVMAVRAKESFEDLAAEAKAAAESEREHSHAHEKESQKRKRPTKT